MGSKDELKDINIKSCTRYYFDNIIKVRDRDIDFSDILLDEEIYKEKYLNLWHFIQTSTGAKPLRFIKIHFGIVCLVLLDCSWSDKIYDSI